MDFVELGFEFLDQFAQNTFRRDDGPGVEVVAKAGRRRLGPSLCLHYAARQGWNFATLKVRA